eukprot:scaffold2375_cov19-Tisochrysis_lutea.AAC.1
MCLINNRGFALTLSPCSRTHFCASAHSEAHPAAPPCFANVSHVTWGPHPSARDTPIHTSISHMTSTFSARLDACHGHLTHSLGPLFTAAALLIRWVLVFRIHATDI